ncbi:TetR family transcriptional regulator [Actinoplanes sp. ATCC 53533]|uniref:TetR/AcrR family transcriptional regulator n=1 Tax=Actinoplanes sp. ATCC 53533 TaxID=1288362 RepID=UPI000F76C2A8|nr:TetR/AcrR family transcriptional regulator [Actinoplanes sp. ATCC 53533]RSM71647.1 TetR family transcriptional regulator [Actinoplanes sp. ATCC 53533]
MRASKSVYQPRKTPTQQRAWRTRTRILAGAARVFAGYGYASGTTDRIAAAAGLSVGSLYQYFPNKDAILLVLAQSHLDQTADMVRQTLTEPRPIEVWLPVLIESVVGLHAGNPRLHQVLFEEAPRPPDLLNRFRQVEDDAVAAVATLLRAEPGLGVVDPDRCARFVVATIESLTHRFMSRTPQIDADDLADEIAAMVTGYLR